MEDVVVFPPGAVHVPRLDHIHRAGEQGCYEPGQAGAAEMTNQAVSQEVSGDQRILKKSLVLTEK